MDKNILKVASNKRKATNKRLVFKRVKSCILHKTITNKIKIANKNFKNDHTKNSDTEDEDSAENDDKNTNKDDYNSSTTTSGDNNEDPINVDNNDEDDDYTSYTSRTKKQEANDHENEASFGEVEECDKDDSYSSSIHEKNDDSEDDSDSSTIEIDYIYEDSINIDDYGEDDGYSSYISRIKKEKADDHENAVHFGEIEDDEDDNTTKRDNCILTVKEEKFIDSHEDTTNNDVGSKFTDFFMIKEIMNKVIDKDSNKQNKFKLEFYKSPVSDSVLVLLKNVLYIQGTIKFYLITGNVEIFGYEPEPKKEYTIYSPRSYANISITPIRKSNLKIDANSTSLKILTKSLSTNLLYKCDKKFIIENWERKYNHETDAIILLKKNEADVVKTINKYMKENMFLDIKELTMRQNPIEFRLKCILDEKEKVEPYHLHYEKNHIIIGPSWDKIKVDENSKILIIGGKNVGKSTLLRYLINKNINQRRKFLLIDLDIGQPEIFLPQTISATVIEQPLLGPGYFNRIQPDKAYWFSGLNFEYYTLKYLEIIKSLIEYCKSNIYYRDMPWIINTMGYNKGIACELLSIIVEILQPTDIIQIQSKKGINNYDYNMNFEKLKSISRDILGNYNNRLGVNGNIKPFRFILTMSMTDYQNQTNDITPGDKRYERILSFCGTLLANDCNNFTDNTNVMQCIVKGEIDFLVGSIVYLCSLTNADEQIECYGLGIVRGIDRDLNFLNIMIASSESTIGKPMCLCASFSPIASSLMFNQGPWIKDETRYIYLTQESIKSKQVFFRQKKPVHFHRAIVSEEQQN